MRSAASSQSTTSGKSCPRRRADAGPGFLPHHVGAGSLRSSNRQTHARGPVAADEGLLSSSRALLAPATGYPLTSQARRPHLFPSDRRLDCFHWPGPAALLVAAAHRRRRHCRAGRPTGSAMRSWAAVASAAAGQRSAADGRGQEEAFRVAGPRWQGPLSGATPPAAARSGPPSSEELLREAAKSRPDVKGASST